MWDDFDTDALAAVSVAGTGTVTWDVAASGGFVSLQTGAGASSFAKVQNAGGSALVQSASGRPWYYHARVRPTIALDAQAHALIGLQNLSTLDSVTLGVWGPSSPDVLSLVVDQVGIGTTIVNTPVSVDLVNLQEWALSFDGTTIRAYVGDEEVASTTDLSNLTAGPVVSLLYVDNGLTAANRKMVADRVATVVEPEP